ncbi:MAG: membrane protein insertion efficiency factor YidD [bacterium]
MRKLLMAMITLYKKGISPYLPQTCRFSPTCSEYSLQAIEKYGSLKGGFMAIKRILRCNPWSKGGFDPLL